MTIEFSDVQDSARQVMQELGLAAQEEKIWPLVLDLGWLQLGVPESLGGLGQELFRICELYIEMGSGLLSGRFISAMLAIECLCRSDIAERDAWIARVTTDGCVAAALGSSALTIAPRSSGCMHVSGLASAIPSADRCSHLLVWASDAGCIGLVPRTALGVESIHRPTWDGTRRLFDVKFNDVELEWPLILATGFAAEALVRRVFIHRDLALAADSVGGARRLLDATVDYLKARRQFGRPLAAFQALKHRCADLKVIAAAAEALLRNKVEQLGCDDAADALGAQAARYLACSAYRHIAEEALQLHGAIGMTSEHACHLFLKRALLNEQLGARSNGDELGIAEGWYGQHIAPSGCR